MVSLEAVRLSNAKLKNLPTGLVALFGKESPFRHSSVADGKTKSEARAVSLKVHSSSSIVMPSNRVSTSWDGKCKNAWWP